MTQECGVIVHVNNVGSNVIMRDELLSCGQNVIMWNEMSSCRIKCYHVRCNVIMLDEILSYGQNISCSNICYQVG